MTFLDKLKRDYQNQRDFEEAEKNRAEFLKEFNYIYENHSSEYIKELLKFNREFLNKK